MMNEDRKAVVLQSFWRMTGPYRRFRSAVRLVVNIQQLFRSRRARNLLKQLKDYYEHEESEESLTPLLELCNAKFCILQVIGATPSEDQKEKMIKAVSELK